MLIHSTHLINQQLYWVPFPCQTLCWRYTGILLPALRVVGETQQEIGVFSVEGHLQALGTLKKMGETFNTNCGTGDSFQKTWHPQGSYLCDEVGAKQVQKRGGVVAHPERGGLICKATLRSRILSMCWIFSLISTIAFISQTPTISSLQVKYFPFLLALFFSQFIRLNWKLYVYNVIYNIYKYRYINIHTSIYMYKHI